MTGAEAVTVPSMPDANDSDWLGAYDNQTRALEKLRGYVEAHRPVWWRRDRFPKGPFRETEPKWHVFLSRTPRPGATYRADVVWRGLCGYTRESNENIFGLFSHKVGTPKAADRCRKCAAALDAIRSGDTTSAEVSEDGQHHELE